MTEGNTVYSGYTLSIAKHTKATPSFPSRNPPVDAKSYYINPSPLAKVLRKKPKENTYRMCGIYVKCTDVISVSPA
jgi:hypothetical protein